MKDQTFANTTFQDGNNAKFTFPVFPHFGLPVLYSPFLSDRWIAFIKESPLIAASACFHGAAGWHLAINLTSYDMSSFPNILIHGKSNSLHLHILFISNSNYCILSASDGSTPKSTSSKHFSWFLGACSRWIAVYLRMYCTGRISGSEGAKKAPETGIASSGGIPKAKCILYRIYSL